MKYLDSKDHLGRNLLKDNFMRNFILFVLFGISVQLYGQVAPAKYLVTFKDKNNSPFSLSHPESFLSQRAIERRTKYNIAYDITDIPVNDTYIQGVIATGAKLIIRVKWINSILVSTDSQTILNAINNLSYVKSVNKINKRSEVYTDTDKFKNIEAPDIKSTLANNDATYGTAYNQINMVNGIPLHQSGFKGNGKVIAILDAGFTNVDTRAIFNTLRTNNQILGTYNFVDPAVSVYGSHAHGTLVLSVMGGNLPGVFLGTAPEASYWLLRTEDAGTEFLIEEYNWIAGAAFADSVGVDIINSSLGYTQFDNQIYDHIWTDLDGNTTPVTKGADLAAKKGILVVNSAGNSGSDSWKYIIAPADGDSVFAIGAVDANKIITSFSSYGFDWDSRIKPNIVAQGGNTVVANEFTDTVKTANGTSFSSPLIAGMMACLWQSMPNVSNKELIKAVEQSASKYTSPNRQYGHGIPDFLNAQLILALNTESPLINDFEIIPNPISSSAFIRWGLSNAFNAIELINLQGKILFSSAIETNATTYRIALDGFPNGIYFLSLSNEHERITKKLIKIN